MSLSKHQRMQQVELLLVTTEIQELISQVRTGHVQGNSLPQEIEYRLQSHPLVLPLQGHDKKAILGMLVGRIRRQAPKKPRKIGPGEKLLALSQQERHVWRRECVETLPVPVAFLYKQVGYGLELPIDHPQRKDLIWDIVNTAVTAVRYVTVVAIADYLDQGLSDPHLNRVLIDALRKPADGAWTMLLFAPEAGKKHSLMKVLTSRDVHLQGLQAMLVKPTTKDLKVEGLFGHIPGLAKHPPKTLKGLADSFVQFRNLLVHGVYSRIKPSVSVVDAMGLLLDIFMAFLLPVLQLEVVVPTKTGLLEAKGPNLGILSQNNVDPATLQQYMDKPVLLAGERCLCLSPWITVADLQTAVYRLAEDATEPEVAIAELCFFNRFEADLLYYLGFAAKAQVMHTELVETEQAEQAYQQFATTLEQLRLRSTPAIARKTDPIQRFDEMASFHGENFVGRRDVITTIEAFVESPSAPIGVMTAAPGMGKSAIFSHFYRQYGGKESSNGWIFHFSARTNQRDNAFLGLRSLIAQAELQHRRNSSSAPKAMPLPWNYEDLCQRLHRALTSLGACMLEKQRYGVVVIDALDEQAPRPGTPPESIFRGLPEEMPPGIVVLVSVRIDKNGKPVVMEAGQLTAPRVHSMAGASPLLGLRAEDVEKLIHEKLAAEKPSLAAVSAQVLGRIAEAAQRPEDGTLDPFYLRFLADGVREGSIDLSEAANVPTGLESFFDELWWTLDDGHDFLLHRMIGMLAEMEGFGSDELFAHALHKPAAEIARLRFVINKLLVQSKASTDEVQYGLFHDRFRWYVQGKFTAYDKAVALHTPLLVACRQGGSAADNYAARYLTYHLQVLSTHIGLSVQQQQAFQQELWQTVYDDGFIERKFLALGDERAIVTDFARAFEVFRPKEHDPPTVQLDKAGKVTWLVTRSSQTVAQVANLARSKLHDYAREGDVLRVIQFAQRAGNDALEWMTLLRAARTMREEQLDPSPLFEAMQASFEPQLLWTDATMLQRLLQEAEVPKELTTWMLSQVPAPPIIKPQGKDEE